MSVENPTPTELAEYNAKEAIRLVARHASMGITSTQPFAAAPLEVPVATSKA